MKHISILSLILIVICASSLPACTSASSTPKTSPSLPSALPTLTPLALLTPSAGLGIVGGNLVEKDTQKPPIEGTLYLGQIVLMSNGNPAVSMERQTAPYAYPAPNGDFIFQNVKPGKYGLIFYTPELNFLIDNPDGSGSLTIEVSSNQVVNVGKIQITTH